MRGPTDRAHARDRAAVLARDVREPSMTRLGLVRFLDSTPPTRHQETTMRLRWWLAAALLTLMLPALAFAQSSGTPVAPMSPEEHLARGSDPSPRAPIPPRGYADDIQALKAAATAAAVPGPVQIDMSAAALGLPTAMAPNAPALLTSFAGQSFLDGVSLGSGAAPPDPVIAAGPGNLVAITNGIVRIYSKTGTVVDTKTM